MRIKLRFYVASVACLLASAGISLGQQHVMPPDPYDSGTMVAPAARSADTSAMPASDFPAAEVRAVPAAMARAAITRGQADVAEKSLGRVLGRLREDFAYSADLLTATRAEKSAYDRYKVEHDRVLRELASHRKYRAMKNLCDDLNARLAELNDDPNPDRQQILAIAELKLRQATKMSQLESDALAADPAVQDAKVHFVDAADKLNDMHTQFARSIRRNDEFLAARKQLEDARISRVAAAAYLDGAVEAANVAVDYAYWIHRGDYLYAPSAFAYPTYDYTYPSTFVYGSVYRQNRWH